MRPLLYSLLPSRREIGARLISDHATSYQTVLHSQTLAVGETRLLNHSLLFVFSGHLRGSCCPRRAGRRRLHSGHQRAAHRPPQTLGGSTNYQEGQGEHHTNVVRVWPQSSGHSPLQYSLLWGVGEAYAGFHTDWEVGGHWDSPSPQAEFLPSRSVKIMMS